MLDAPYAGCAEVEILTSERPIDTKCRACTLACGDNGELHILDHIPGDKHTGDARRLVLTTADAAATIELTSQGSCEFGAADAGRVEEQRRTLEHLSVRKLERVEFSPDTPKCSDRLLEYTDVVAL